MNGALVYTETTMPTNSSRVYSVSELITGLRELFHQAIGTITVQGEITGYRTPKSNLVYFEVKDDSSCMLCFALAHEIGIQLEDGLEVQVVGYPSFFQKRGSFHFRVVEIRPVGQGAIQKALDALKVKLESEGLFRSERKRALPKFPERVGLITSPDAAAYTDVLRVLQNRWGSIDIKFFPVAVQGIGAARQIVKAFDQANSFQLDVVILTRGGGSLEDLQAFNDEAVARAVFASSAPVVCGVGHERDWTTADLVADKRAATPSNAAELVTPDRIEVAASIEAIIETMEAELLHRTAMAKVEVDDLLRELVGALENRTVNVRRLLERVDRYAPELDRRIFAAKQQLESSVHGIDRAATQLIGEAERRLNERFRLLRSFSPQATLDRGYSITRLSKNGPLIKSIKQLRPGRVVTTTLADGSFDSTVTRPRP